MPRTLVDNVEQTSSLVLEPLTVEQYHAMIERGILREGLPIELIDGLLVRKDRRDREGTVLTVGPRHGLVLGELADRLRDGLRGSAVHVREQLPVTLSDTQEPEPDVAVVVGRRSDYRTGHPGPADVLLVVEVSDSSLSFDRRDKLRTYAAAGLATYWIVNLSDETVEVYTSPQSQHGSYGQRNDVRRGDRLTIDLAGTVLDLAVSEILV